MTREDMIANERTQAANYRREAKRRTRYPALAAMLLRYAEASESRIDCLRAGPLFEVAEPKGRGV